MDGVALSTIVLYWTDQWRKIYCHCGKMVLPIIKKPTGHRLNINIIFPRYGDSHVKIRWPQDRLMFNMGIPILVRWHLYLRRPPGYILTSIQCTLTHWPLGDWTQILYKYIQPGFNYWWLKYLEWNCPHVIVTAPHIKSTLVQVLAWSHQASNHYLSQYWPRSMSPYGITRKYATILVYVHQHKFIWTGCLCTMAEYTKETQS